MKALSVILVALAILFLVRRRLLQVDLSFPLFLALIALGLASTSETFIERVASWFGVVYEPLVVILIALAILLALVIVLAVAHSRLRQRQIMIVRHIAAVELDGEEQLAQRHDRTPVPRTPL
jgi:predicted membrane protein